MEINVRFSLQISEDFIKIKNVGIAQSRPFFGVLMQWNYVYKMSYKPF